MNKKITYVILGILLLSVLVISNAWADRYLGETTWTVTITSSSDDNPPEAITLTGGISRVNSSYYLFQGYVLDPNSLDPPVILSGSGVVIDNNLILTLKVSQDHPSGWRDTGVLRATLNRTTLNGTFYEVHTDLSPDRTYDEGYNIGTLSRSGKTIPLNPVMAPINQLLLDTTSEDTTIITHAR